MTAAVVSRPSPSALVGGVRRSVDALREAAPGHMATDWDHGERQTVIAGLDKLIQELTVYRGHVLLAHRKDGRWGTSHDRDFADWRARETGTGRGPALGELELAEGLDTMPQVAEAVGRGELNIEHAKALSKLRSKASPEVREALDKGGVGELVDLGKRLSAPELNKHARKWAAEVDAAAAQKEFDSVRRRRTLTLRNHAGGVKGEFFLDAVAGAELRTALDAVAGRPAKDDQRSREMRMADALSTMASRVLQVGADLNGAQVRPHISLLVNEDTWAAIQRRRQAAEAEASSSDGPPPELPLPDAPPAVMEDGTIIPLRELERIMCDCEVTRMVMNALGVPLDIGQTQRTYSKELRRGVTARDKTCQWPGCQIRASWCEVHHVRWFSRGGHTSLDNGISLCSYHHHRVHDQGVRITVVADGFDFHYADGRHLGTSRRLDPYRRVRKPDEGGGDKRREQTVGAAPRASSADGALAVHSSRLSSPPPPVTRPWAEPRPPTMTPVPQNGSKLRPPATASDPPVVTRPAEIPIFPATYATASSTSFGPDPPF